MSVDIEKITATFTPKRSSLSFEYEKSTNQEQLIRAIQERLKTAGKTSLSRHDEQFLLGIVSVFPLHYAADILKLVRESDEVEVSVA